jgi:protein tyrosine phosphatase (PTP) superfamily phosphohydrolase (DUF442 family)
MIEDLYNFLSLSEKLLTSGMPTADQLKSASEAGVQVVINLAPFDPKSDLANEGELVKSLGMKYINIPVDWESPSHRNLEEFMKAMDSHQQDKLLVHCRANYRVSGFIALYRILRLHWEPQAAFKDLRRIWNPDEYPVWKRFIEESLEAENK